MLAPLHFGVICYSPAADANITVLELNVLSTGIRKLEAGALILVFFFCLKALVMNGYKFTLSPKTFLPDL